MKTYYIISFIIIFIILTILIQLIRFIIWLFKKFIELLNYNTPEQKHMRLRKKFDKAEKIRNKRYKNSWKYK